MGEWGCDPEDTSSWCGLQCIQQWVGSYSDFGEECYCSGWCCTIQAVVSPALWSWNWSQEENYSFHQERRGGKAICLNYMLFYCIPVQIFSLFFTFFLLFVGFFLSMVGFAPFSVVGARYCGMVEVIERAILCNVVLHWYCILLLSFSLVNENLKLSTSDIGHLCLSLYTITLHCLIGGWSCPCHCHHWGGEEKQPCPEKAREAPTESQAWLTYWRAIWWWTFVSLYLIATWSVWPCWWVCDFSTLLFFSVCKMSNYITNF